MIRVSEHAIDRWIERAGECSRDEAREAILAHSPVLEVAAKFGCSMVRIDGRLRIVLRGRTVVTITPPEMFAFPQRR